MVSVLLLIPLWQIASIDRAISKQMSLYSRREIHQGVQQIKIKKPYIDTEESHITDFIYVVANMLNYIN